MNLKRAIALNNIVCLVIFSFVSIAQLSAAKNTMPFSDEQLKELAQNRKGNSIILSPVHKELLSQIAHLDLIKSPDLQGSIEKIETGASVLPLHDFVKIMHELYIHASLVKGDDAQGAAQLRKKVKKLLQEIEAVTTHLKELEQTYLNSFDTNGQTDEYVSFVEEISDESIIISGGRPVYTSEINPINLQTGQRDDTMTTTFSGFVLVQKDLTITGSLDVIGSSTFHNDLTVVGDLFVDGTIIGGGGSGSQSYTFTNDILVEGNETLTGDLIITGSIRSANPNNQVEVNSNMEVLGTAKVSNILYVNEIDPYSGNTTSFNGNVNILSGNNLTVAGGNATIDGNMSLTGDLVITGSIVSGNSDNTVEVNSGLQVIGTSTFNQNVTVQNGGILFVDEIDPTSASNTTTFSGQVFLTQNVTVSNGAILTTFGGGLGYLTANGAFPGIIAYGTNDPGASNAGIGILTTGGAITTGAGSGGAGLQATGGSSVNGDGGPGATITGGNSSSGGVGGVGLIVSGGAGANGSPKALDVEGNITCTGVLYINEIDPMSGFDTTTFSGKVSLLPGKVLYVDQIDPATLGGTTTFGGNLFFSGPIVFDNSVTISDSNILYVDEIDPATGATTTFSGNIYIESGNTFTVAQGPLGSTAAFIQGGNASAFPGFSGSVALTVSGGAAAVSGGLFGGVGIQAQGGLATDTGAFGGDGGNFVGGDSLDVSGRGGQGATMIGGFSNNIGGNGLMAQGGVGTAGGAGAVITAGNSTGAGQVGSTGLLVTGGASDPSVGDNGGIGISVTGGAAASGFTGGTGIVANGAFVTGNSFGGIGLTANGGNSGTGGKGAVITAGTSTNGSNNGPVGLQVIGGNATGGSGNGGAGATITGGNSTGGGIGGAGLIVTGGTGPNGTPVALDVEGNITSTGVLYINEIDPMSGFDTTTFSGNVSLLPGKILYVDQIDPATLSGTINFGNNVFFSGPVVFDNTVTVSDGFTLYVDEIDPTNLSDTTSFSGNVFMSQNLEVTGTTTLDSHLEVLGTTTLNDHLDVVGTTSLKNNVTVENGKTLFVSTVATDATGFSPAVTFVSDVQIGTFFPTLNPHTLTVDGPANPFGAAASINGGSPATGAAGNGLTVSGGNSTTAAGGYGMQVSGGSSSSGVAGAKGITVTGGPSDTGNSGNALEATGGGSGLGSDQTAGTGVVATGGANSVFIPFPFSITYTGTGGIGLQATGGDGALGGVGARIAGGVSHQDAVMSVTGLFVVGGQSVAPTSTIDGGYGIFAQGGVGQWAGNGGIGIVCTGGEPGATGGNPGFAIEMDGNATLTGDLIITGSIRSGNSNNTVEINAGLEVIGSATVDTVLYVNEIDPVGPQVFTEFSGGLVVDLSSTFNSDLTVDGNLYVNGTIIGGGSQSQSYTFTNDVTILAPHKLLVNEIDPESGNTTSFSGNVFIELGNILTVSGGPASGSSAYILGGSTNVNDTNGGIGLNVVGGDAGAYVSFSATGGVGITAQGGNALLGDATVNPPPFSFGGPGIVSTGGTGIYSGGDGADFYGGSITSTNAGFGGNGIFASGGNALNGGTGGSFSGGASSQIGATGGIGIVVQGGTAGPGGRGGIGIITTGGFGGNPGYAIEMDGNATLTGDLIITGSLVSGNPNNTVEINSGLEVIGSATFDNALTIVSTATLFVNEIAPILGDTTTFDGNVFMSQNLTLSFNEHILGNLTVDENITVYGAVINPSDERAKTEVKSIDPAQSLEKILGLTPRTFKFTESFKGIPVAEQQSERGFIAQELKAVLPELISVSPRTVNDQVIQDFHHVNYIKLVVDLAGSIQALNEKHETFKKEALAEIEALKSQINKA